MVGGAIIDRHRQAEGKFGVIIHVSGLLGEGSRRGRIQPRREDPTAHDQ
ncbi:Uncharacterised protein [Mycobacteroides abscessus subsp. abscessus]|nr:Uncharacterised protein [Mycobacteroides abscessus subsp. abscessus]